MLVPVGKTIFQSVELAEVDFFGGLIDKITEPLDIPCDNTILVQFV